MRVRNIKIKFMFINIVSVVIGENYLYLIRRLWYIMLVDKIVILKEILEKKLYSNG